MLKATEGVGFEDAAFRRHRVQAGRVGLPTGAYHYARPDTVLSADDAGAEADWFLDVVQTRAGDLLPALDLEVAGLPRDRLADWALEWLARVGAAIGMRALLYTSPSFFSEHLTRAGQLAEHSLLWLADWGLDDGKPHLPRPIGAWRGPALHQYTSRGRVRGVAGRLDLSRLGDGFTLDAIRLDRAGPPEAAWGPPWRAFAGGRVGASSSSWLDPRFQARLRALASRYPAVTVRGTRRGASLPPNGR
jgi:GH25 family lysozyme M1 (1,4-beta-N-acetylmuramidase)